MSNLLRLGSSIKGFCPHWDLNLEPPTHPPIPLPPEPDLKGYIYIYWMWAIVTNDILGLYWVSILFNRSIFQLCGVYLVYLCYFIWLYGGLKPMGWIWIVDMGNDMRPATCTIWMLIVNMVLLEHCCWCINNESLLCQTEYEVRFKWHCLVLDLSYQLEFCFFSFWCFCHFVFLSKKKKKRKKDEVVNITTLKKYALQFEISGADF